MYTNFMILILHIVIALSSLLYTTYAFFLPSARKLQVSYGLVGLTLASGTFLVIRNPAHLLQSCTTGFLYLAIVTVGIITARHKLAANSGL